MNLALLAALIMVLLLGLGAVAVRRFVLQNSDFWMAMGLILSDRKSYEKALYCFGKAVEIYPFYVYARGNKGLSLYRLGRYDEALRCYEEALLQNPRFGEGWHNKGLVLQKLGREEEAEEAFDRAENLGIKDAGPPEDPARSADAPPDRIF